MRVRWLGRVPYAEAAALQERLVRDRRLGVEPDTLLLLEHTPVITLGRSARLANVRISPEEASRSGIEIVESGRGGDVTYHGPGQLVGYPVVALVGGERDAHAYLRRLEDVLIDVGRHYGVEAARVPGLTGVWVGNEKLAAIGVRISTGWITSHGFALNVARDLSGFDAIVPCGIRDRGVTSIESLTGRAVSIREVAGIVAACAARRLARCADATLS